MSVTLFENKDADREIKRLFNDISRPHLLDNYYYLHVLSLSTTSPICARVDEVGKSQALNFTYLEPGGSHKKWPDKSKKKSFYPLSSPHRCLCWRLFTQIMHSYAMSCKISATTQAKLKKANNGKEVAILKLEKEVLWNKLQVACSLFERLFKEHYGVLIEGQSEQKPLRDACAKYNEEIANSNAPELIMPVGHFTSLERSLYSYINHFSSMWSFYLIVTTQNERQLRDFINS